MRLLLDISYTVIVTTIGLNIVLGIIVDSFSQLKNERVKFAYNLQILHCSWCNVHHSVYTIQHVSHYHTRVRLGGKEGWEGVRSNFSHPRQEAHDAHAYT